jgi:glycosyltransferase involved in cell wall biosynthesis
MNSDTIDISTMSRLRISVAMCTRNGAKYLETQLRSIASQSVLPDELIVCDDGSTDQTRSRVEDFINNAPFPVRFHTNPEALGPAKNFEKAIRLCNGEIIVLADQDDEWKRTKLETLRQVFENNPDAIYAFSDAELMDDTGTPLGQTLWDAVGLRKNLERFSGDRQLEVLLRHNIITGAAMAFRASFRDIALPIAPGWMHDYWLVLVASLISSGIPVSEPLFMYRQHPGQVCGWRKKTFFQVFKDSLHTGKENWAEKVEQFKGFLKHADSIEIKAHCIPSRMKLVREKELHLARRAETRSSSGLLRIIRALAEASTGRYQRFSNSWYSVARDL